MKKKFYTKLQSNIEVFYFHSIIPIGVIIVLSAIYFRFLLDESSEKMSGDKLLLILISVATFFQISFTLNDRRKKARNEYITNLVFKWHSTISEMSKDKNSIIGMTLDAYNKMDVNTWERRQIDNQFQYLIDLMSLIYADVVTSNSLYDSKKLLIAWGITFCDTIFCDDLSLHLWELKKLTLVDEPRSYIDAVIKKDFSSL